MFFGIAVAWMKTKRYQLNVLHDILNNCFLTEGRHLQQSQKWIQKIMQRMV